MAKAAKAIAKRPVRRITGAERDAALRAVLEPPNDELMVDGMDMSMSVQHPRFPNGGGLAGVFAQRIEQWASVLDGAFTALQNAASQAKRRNDDLAMVAIQSKLADHAARMLTSPVTASFRPEAPQIDLEQFTPETRSLLLAAFAAAQRELEASGEGKEE